MTSVRGGASTFACACARDDAGLPVAVLAPGGALSGLAASEGLVELAEVLTAIRVGDALRYKPHVEFG